MNSNSSFNVGGTPLDRNKYNADRFAKFTDIAAKVPVEDNKSPEEWREIADRIKKDDCVSKEDLAAMQDLSKAARPERTRLRKELAARLTDKHRQFLIGLARAEPDWSQLVCAHAGELPALRWKLENLHRFRERRPVDFKRQADRLEELLFP